MKKKILFILLIIPVLSFAQVGLNTDDPKANLDIRGANHNGAVTSTDGILIPRVNNLTANGSENGQMVYLTANNGNFIKGFHYWNGTVWRAVSNGKTAGVFDAGEEVILGNFKVKLATTGGRSLQIATLSGTALISGQSNADYGTLMLTKRFYFNATTTYQYVVSYSFPDAGNLQSVYLHDVTNGGYYEIKLIIGGSYLNNAITFEKIF